MAKGVKRSRLRTAIVEMADDLHRLGMMDDARHKTITLRDVGKNIESYDGRSIKGHQLDEVPRPSLRYFAA